ncbi:MAG: HD domain-containing protein [Clostridia bacterium]|nr:HD domain-containing protein [Clostridia bacterium]
MRLSAQQNENENQNKNYKIIAVDDEIGIIDSLSVFLRHSGYTLVGCTDPYEAIEKVKNEKYDLMLLDFMMSPIHGDTVVEEIRKFNKELYIILLTGHKDLVPPLETIKRLSIQAYCEKEDKFDQLLLLIESAFKSIEQMQTIKEMNEELKASKDKIEKAYLETIQMLRYTVEAKDTYIRGHSDRVSAYSVLIGQELGLYDKDIATLRIGGLFHDIGKIGISDTILLKPSKLTDEEYNELKKHPSIGKQIVSTSSIFRDIVPIIYSHHERYDGNGYPQKLKGDQISFLARIVSVADAFDAMTSKRSYRDEMDLEYVKNQIKEGIGTQFDPEAANVMLNILENKLDKINEIRAKFPC